MLFHDELFTRSQCTYCQQEISSLGVECVECHNGNFRLCVDCFSLGAEIGQHKSDHKYRFFDCGSLVLSSNPNKSTASSGVQKEPEPTASSPTDSPKWSAREEIRLLDAIEQYGFGNWQDISKHIESKTPAEAKTHYVNRYVNGTLGQLTWSTGVPNEVNRNICNTQIQKPVDHTIPSDEGPLSPSLTRRLPPLEISADEMLQLGYMPNRDDYEKEFDNEAEKLVSQLSFTTDDDELDIGLKLALVDMYTRRLRERARRKRMIRDYQLVSKFFKKDKVKTNGTSGESSGTKGQFSTYEKMLQEKLRPFAQFYNSKEHENLIRNLVKEKELKFRLAELYKYRRNGIRRPEECAEYEKLKGNAAVLKGKRNLETIPEGENQEGRSGNKKAALAENLVAPLLVRQLQQAVPPNSPKTKVMMTSIGSDESGGGSPSVGRNLTQPLFSNEDFNLKSYMESSESGPASLQQGLAVDAQRGMETPLLATVNSSLPSEKLRASADLYTADYAPSSDLLTEKELQFCLKTTITPAQFLTLKTALLLARKPKIDNNQQSMELKDVPCPPNITSNEWEQVISFFKTNYI